MLKSSIQHELDRFFQVLLHKKLPFHQVWDSAFSQARKKLKPAVFKELNQIQVDYFYNHFKIDKWRGFRLLAIDGSTVELPNSNEIQDYFGVHMPNDHKKDISLARVSVCFDLLNQVTLDAEVGKYKGKGEGEQEHAVNHTQHMKAGDLILMDRNYPSFYLFSLLLSKGIHYCCRLKTGSWKLAKQLASSDQDQLVEFIYPSKQAKKRCRQLGVSCEPIAIRLVKVVLDSGEVEVLATSLLDEKAYGFSVFGGLYFQRWGIEESYKAYKHKLEIENFSGKSVLSIFQDIYATVFSANLTSILTTTAKEKIKQVKAKHPYKVNLSNAYRKMKNSIILLFDQQERSQTLDDLIPLFAIKPIPIRPNRKCERNFGRHARRYYMNYKQC